VTFLTSAAGLRDAVRGGPVRAQADDVLALLGDHHRCQVVLVTLPETTPVNELLETAELLQQRVGVRLGPTVINQVDVSAPLPDPVGVSFGRAKAYIDDARAAAEFRRIRQTDQATEIERLAAGIGAASVVLPALPTAALEPHDIDALAMSATR
jgi:hypothetical protein